MNVHAKILNKILRNWIREYIKRNIHCDPGEFIPNIQEWINIHKDIDVIFHINETKDKQ